jgi:uncharacterized membrane protein HdeD (DUF308 family)
MGIEFINDILNDLWHFHLIIIGIALSIFTLLYSFILNKIDELKAISEQIKIEGSKTNPILVQRERFAVNYILRLKKINKGCILIFLISTMLFCVSWVTQRFVCNQCALFKKWVMLVMGILSILLCIYIVFQFFKIYKQYLYETNI